MIAFTATAEDGTFYIDVSGWVVRRLVRSCVLELFWDCTGLVLCCLGNHIHIPLGFCLPE